MGDSKSSPTSCLEKHLGSAPPNSYPPRSQIVIVRTVSYGSDENDAQRDVNIGHTDKATGHVGKDTGHSGNDTGHWDKGWAWMVAIGASICNLIIFGSTKASGIILNEVVVRFDSPSAYSIIIFLLCASTALLTPLGSYLSSKVACRYLVMVGGGLITTGLLITAFATHIAMVFVGMGFLVGTGGGFILPSSFIIINQHFREKRSKGFALATLGSGIGGLVFAPVIGYCFEVYGFTGALIIQAGLMLHLQVGGALMRPPPPVKTVLQEEREVRKYGGQESEVNKYGGPEPEVNKYGGQVPEVNNFGRQELEVSKYGQQGRNEEQYGENIPLVQHVKQRASKLDLFKNLTFILYLFNMSCGVLPAVVIYLPAYGLEKGVPTSVSSWVLSLSGLADIIGRVLSGLFFDKVQRGRKRVFHSLAGLCASLVVISLGFIDTFTSLCVITFFFGFFEAIFNAQRTEIPFEFVPAENMANAVGAILFAEYLGIMLGPVMHGLVWNTYGTYAVGYVIGGSLFACTCLLMVMDFLRGECCMRNQ